MAEHVYHVLNCSLVMASSKTYSETWQYKIGYFSKWKWHQLTQFYVWINFEIRTDGHGVQDITASKVNHEAVSKVGEEEW